ncbi:MAG TPA: STAS domain-containing protein [Bryobacteraceae bacterium]|nr:STAS domain-containing protein [Bryobacteraceae bacterium]
MDLHRDPVHREELIRGYLSRRLSPELTEAFESHYLGCDECFEETQATRLLIRALGEPVVERQRINDVTVIRFQPNARLQAASLELKELVNAVRLENDRKVLIDLSRVSRIDSTGLGVLMNCYAHAVKNSGVLKLLHPDAPVKRILSMTKIDSVVETFADEASAIESFSAVPS